MRKLIFLFFFAFAALAQEENGTKTNPKLPSPKGNAGKVLGSDGTKLIWKSATDGVHPAISVTNNAAPFSFNASTQTLNIPQAATLTDNGNGTITLNKGDGTSVTVGAADDKTNAAITINGTNYAAGTTFETLITALNANSHKATTLTDNGDGTMKFTNGDGVTIDSVQVYLIPEPLFVAKYSAATETLLNSTQSIGYTQGGLSKTLTTKANMIYIDSTAAAIQTINIPDPSAAANAGFEFSITWLKVANQVTFNYPIYDRVLGVLYSSTTFVPDNRDLMTVPKLLSADVLFKAFPYSTIHIVNTNGKYLIKR